MRIKQVVWLHQFAEKIERKHHVSQDEVEQVFLNRPTFQFAELYRAMGQTDGGRYLIVFFVYKHGGRSLVISARNPTKGERRHYA